MYILRRKIARTERPQPVYPFIVDQTVRTWIPAAAMLLACVVTPGRAKGDVRTYDWAPQSGWMGTVAAQGGPSVAALSPAVSRGLISFRTANGRPSYDIRLNDGSTGSFGTPLDQSEAWQAAIDAERSATTPDRRRLDVRRHEWAPESGWLFSALSATGPTVAQQWPAVLLNTGLNYRTPARAVFDVRLDWSTSFGLPSAIDTAVRSWMPSVAGSELASTRTRDGAKLDVRSYAWSPDSAWLFTAQPPPVTVAQTWPAVSFGTGTQYQTAKRPTLDVRGYDWQPAFQWAQPVVDTQVRAWMAAVAGDHGARTCARPPLDVRNLEWSPAPAWIVQALPVPSSVAQQWPGVLLGLGLNYRTVDHPRLDVRVFDWMPAFSWLEVLDLVDGVPQSPSEYFIVEAQGRWFFVQAVRGATI